MKKILVTILSLSLLCMLVACASDSNDTIDDGIKEEINTTNENIESMEKETEDDELNVETTEEESETIKEKIFVSEWWFDCVDENYWYFYADTTGNGEYKWYVYDLISERVMESVVDSFLDQEDCSGISMVNEDGLIDITTGKMLYTLNDDSKFISDLKGGKILVKETIQSFLGASTFLSVVNTEGDVSYTTAIEKFPEYKRIYNNGDDSYFFIAGEDFNEIYYAYIDSGNWKITKCSGTKFILYKDGYYLIKDVDSEVYNYYYRGTLISSTSYDGSRFNGEAVLATDTLYHFGRYSVDIDSNVVYVADLIDGFIGEYEHVRFKGAGILEGRFQYGVSKNRIALAQGNGAGAIYLCVYNVNGNMDMEPLRIDNMVDEVEYNDVVLTEDYLIVGTDYIYNINTNEEIKKTAQYEFVDVGSKLCEKGYYLVKGTHPKYGEGYYLVKEGDFDTMINPFDNK